MNRVTNSRVNVKEFNKQTTVDFLQPYAIFHSKYMLEMSITYTKKTDNEFLFKTFLELNQQARVIGVLCRF